MQAWFGQPGEGQGKDGVGERPDIRSEGDGSSFLLDSFSQDSLSYP